LKLDEISKYAWVSRTGRGYHIYVKEKDKVGPSQKYDKLHIEKKSNGTYLIAPPSVHSSGTKYRFVTGENHNALPVLQPRDTNTMWEQLVQAVSNIRGIPYKPTVFIEQQESDAPCIDIIKKGVEQGKRNDTAYALANFYRFVKKLTRDEVQVIMNKWNNENKPSLADQEIKSTVESVFKQNKQSGCNKIRQLGFCPYMTQKECPFINKSIPIKMFSHAPGSLEELYERIDKWLYMPNKEMVDLVLAVAISRTLKSKTPLWVFLIGSSGDGKTEIVGSLDGMDGVRKLDQITPNSFSSGMRYKGEKVPDLGGELENKSTLLIFKDLANLTSMDAESKNKIWGLLRTLYDGDIIKDTGSGVQVMYSNCHVTILGCATKMFKQEIMIKEKLGTRELQFDLPCETSDESKKREMAMSHFGFEQQMKDEIRESMQGFVSTHEIDPLIEIPDEVIQFIHKACDKLKILRASAFNDWYSGGELAGNVDSEVTTRLSAQLLLLYRSLIGLDKKYSFERYKSIVENIVRSSSNPIRYDIYELFQKERDCCLKIDDIVDTLRIGRKAVFAQCEVLWNIRYLDRQRTYDENRFGRQYEQFCYKLHKQKSEQKNF